MMLTKFEIMLRQCLNLRLLMFQKSLGPDGVKTRIGFPGSFRNFSWFNEEVAGFQGLCKSWTIKLNKHDKSAFLIIKIVGSWVLLD